MACQYPPTLQTKLKLENESPEDFRRNFRREFERLVGSLIPEGYSLTDPEIDLVYDAIRDRNWLQQMRRLRPAAIVAGGHNNAGDGRGENMMQMLGRLNPQIPIISLVGGSRWLTYSVEGPFDFGNFVFDCRENGQTVDCTRRLQPRAP